MSPDPARPQDTARPRQASSAQDTARASSARDSRSHHISHARVLDVDPLIDDPETRIVVCCGSGGVGKTTTAAALGLRAAERGRRVVVLTIDPARRLAQSMGIDSLDNTPRRVKGVDGDGELHAMMLDMKRTFDEIVEAHADRERAAAILSNPFYQSLSAGFAGTQEYMAMEKLGQLRAQHDWDLIVVDTPPSRSALDFLDAPKRLGSFLDGKLIRLLTAPAEAGRTGRDEVPERRHVDDDRHDRQAARRSTPQGRPDVRGRDGHHLRRLPHARGRDVQAAPGARDGVPGRRGPGAGRAARGRVLRGAAGGRGDAAGRSGPQPGARQRSRPAVGRAGTRRRGKS